MIKFRDLFECEVYKINRKHALLRFCIAILVVVLALTALSAVIKSVLGDFMITGAESGNSAEMIEAYKQEIEVFEQNQTWLNKLLPDNTLYTLKSQLAMYEYLNENGIAANGVTTYSAESSIFEFDYYGFTEMCMGVVMLMVSVFIIVVCCRATTGEYSSGALKMQFIRPINKNKFFTAKWLSIFVIAETFLILSFILSFVLGVIVFGANAPKVLFVIGGNKVFLSSAFGALVLGMFFKSVMLFAHVQVTMFVCSFFKNGNKALVISLLLIALGIGNLLEEILALGYVGFVGFFSNLDWMSALTLSGPAFKGMTLWTMIPITLIWCAVFMYLSYRRFERLEV